MKKLLFWILLLGLVLRLISLNQSFWLDEATSAQVVRNFNLEEIISKFSPGDFHPPLYYLLLKVWSLIFGTGEIALRIPSVIFGLLTIYITFLIGRELVNRKTGLTAAVLLATSALHVYYSQEARMYSLIAFLVTLSVFSFMKILKRGRLRDFLIFGLVLVTIAASDYVGVFIFLAFWVYVIVFKQSKKFFPKFIASHIILLLFAVLWLPVFLKQLNIGLSVNTTALSWWHLLGTFSLKNVFLIPVKFVLGRISFDNKVVYGLVTFLAFILFGYSLAFSLKKIRRSALIWFWLLIPIALGVIVSFKISILSYFRFIFCLPALYLLCATGLSRLKPKFQNFFLLIMVLVNIVFSGIYLFNLGFHRENWRGLVSFINKESNNTNSITLFVADLNMEAYRYYDSSAKISGPEGLNSGFNQVWLMRYLQPVFDPFDTLRAKIQDAGYNKEGEYDFNGVVVWKYVKNI